MCFKNGVCTVAISLVVLSILCNASLAEEYAKVFTDKNLKDSGIDIGIMDQQDIFMLRKIIHSMDEFASINEGIEQFESLAEMREVDLNNDGIEDVVALMNYNSTSDPAELCLLCSREHEFVAQALPTERAMMDDSVLDLNNDGIYEILLKSSLIGETPHALVFYWVDVYSWDEQSYVKSNERFFESFYIRRYLPKISKRIALAKELLRSGEENTLISSVLEDCRIALEKVYTLQNAESK